MAPRALCHLGIIFVFNGLLHVLAYPPRYTGIAFVLELVSYSKVTELTDREALYTELTQAPGVRWATAVVDSQRIDEINILEATKEAMAVSARSRGGIRPAKVVVISSWIILDS